MEQGIFEPCSLLEVNRMWCRQGQQVRMTQIDGRAPKDTGDWPTDNIRPAMESDRIRSRLYWTCLVPRVLQ